MMMQILKDSTKIKLNKKWSKILHVYSVLSDSSIVIMGVLNEKQNCLAHIACSGQILNQIQFASPINSFGMLSQKQIIAVEIKKKCLVIWNIQTYKLISVPFKFKSKDINSCFIHIFSETNLICLQENGNQNNPYFRLSYFKYPLQPDSQPFHVYYSQDTWKEDYLIRKLNNKSHICWLNTRQYQQLQMHTYNLQDQYQIYCLENTFKKKGKVKKCCELSVCTVWEMRPQQLMLVCECYREGSPNNNFVWDLKNNMIRQSKFRFGNYQQLLDHEFNLGKVSMFRTVTNYKCSPVFYVDNSRQQVVAQEKWECSYLNKYEIPDYEDDLLVESLFKNQNIDEIEVMVKKIVDLKIVYTHFLNEILEEQKDAMFLEEIVNMLCPQKQK